MKNFFKILPYSQFRRKFHQYVYQLQKPQNATIYKQFVEHEIDYIAPKNAFRVRSDL